MNIIIHAYNTCCQNEMGGVQARARKFYDLFKKKGFAVSFFNPFETIIKKGDIVHIFGARIENLDLIRCAKSKGARVIISTIINIGRGFKVDLFRLFINKIPHLITIQKMMFSVLNEADYLIAETNQEKEYLVKHYKVDRNKIGVIPNGVEPLDNEIRKDIFDYVDGKYALCVGRIDENKNQLNLIKALKNSSVKLVLIGGPDYENNKSNSYYDKCILEAKDSSNIVFLGWQKKNSPLMKSAYQNAEVVVIPSFNETFGMTIIEGAMSGAKLVISKTLPILEYECFDNCQLFDPKNIRNMQAVIMRAFDEEKTDTLKNCVIKAFSWERVIDSHINLYKGLLDDSSKDKNTHQNN